MGPTFFMCIIEFTQCDFWNVVVFSNYIHTTILDNIYFIFIPMNSSWVYFWRALNLCIRYGREKFVTNILSRLFNLFVWLIHWNSNNFIVYSFNKLQVRYFYKSNKYIYLYTKNNIVFPQFKIVEKIVEIKRNLFW